MQISGRSGTLEFFLFCIHTIKATVRHSGSGQITIRNALYGTAGNPNLMQLKQIRFNKYQKKKIQNTNKQSESAAVAFL